MEDDAGEEQEPQPKGRLTATSSYDIYMVDTPKENNGEERKDAAEDILWRSNQSADVSGAALNPATAKTAITAQK